MNDTIITVRIQYPPEGEEFVFSLPASGVSVKEPIESAFGLKLEMPEANCKIVHEFEYIHGERPVHDSRLGALHHLPFLYILHAPEMPYSDGDIKKAEEQFISFLSKHNQHKVSIELANDF